MPECPGCGTTRASLCRFDADWAHGLAAIGETRPEGCLSDDRRVARGDRVAAASGVLVDVVDRAAAAATELRSMLAAQPYAHPMEASRWLKTYGTDILILLEAKPCPLSEGWSCFHLVSVLGESLRAEHDVPGDA